MKDKNLKILFGEVLFLYSKLLYLMNPLTDNNHKLWTKHNHLKALRIEYNKEILGGELTIAR